MSESILITGGAGFLGSNLAHLLLKAGHKVIAVDNLSTGRLANLEDCLNNSNFTFIKHDITIPLELNEKFSCIYNAACPASPPAYQGIHALETTKACVYGVLNLLELARKHEACFLQFSTSEVYGDPLVHPQVEGYRGNVNPIGIRSCYDEGKRVAESICFDYWRIHNVRVKIVRIFNTYGPLMDPDDGRVVSNFICQALRNMPITLYGDGSQTRSFCYVDDLLRGIVSMMNSEPEFMGPVNLGNPNEFTVRELAQKVLQITGSKSELVYKPLPQDDPKVRRPDITLAQTRLNYSPQVQLEEGLIKTIAYFEAALDR